VIGVRQLRQINAVAWQRAARGRRLLQWQDEVMP
jgi:hypothetical protein